MVPFELHKEVQEDNVVYLYDMGGVGLDSTVVGGIEAGAGYHFGVYDGPICGRTREHNLVAFCPFWWTPELRLRSNMR